MYIPMILYGPIWHFPRSVAQHKHFWYFFSDTLENNESLREELDEIVGGLQTYLAQVQTKAAKKEKDFDILLKDNEEISNRCRKLESELSVVDQEANSLKNLERVSDTELNSPNLKV